jgi:hypothetical protein
LIDSVQLSERCDRFQDLLARLTSRCCSRFTDVPGTVSTCRSPFPLIEAKADQNAK